MSSCKNKIKTSALMGIAGVIGWFISKKKKNHVAVLNDQKVTLDYPLAPSGVTKENAKQWFAITVVMYHFYDVNIGACSFDERIISISPLNSQDYFAKTIEFLNNTDSPSVLNLSVHSEQEFNQMMLEQYKIIME